MGTLKKVVWLVIAGGVAVAIIGASDNNSDKSASAGVFPGHRARIKSGWLACRKSRDLERIKTLFSESDRAAAATFAMAHDCKVLDRGETGIVEDSSVWSANTCIRTPGVPDCYWFPTQFIEPAD